MSLILLTLRITCVAGDYWKIRDTLIKQDEANNLGSKLSLSEKEESVNEALMKLKVEEYDKPGNLSPETHFFHSRATIEKSAVLKFIQKVPKGANLHGHELALVSGEFLFKLTYWPQLYGCKDPAKLTFLPGDDDCKLLSDYRRKNPKFDTRLKRNLTLIVEDPITAYHNINVVWCKFNGIFKFIREFLTYRPVFEMYFYQVLQELHNDNVMYMEVRATLTPLYEINKTYTPTETLGIYKSVVDDFKTSHANFIGAKFIYTPTRHANNETIRKYIETFQTLLASYPDCLAGFDLGGQEDLGQPLVSFLTELLTIRSSTKFFFHAGETKRYGSSTDYNLFDAILLGTSRIGHAYSLVKHPTLLQEVILRDIAIEITPISNQVFALVEDIRNHPGNFLIANGFPVVICNDGPSFWGAKALSYDWYVAFMGMTSRNTGLKFLKQIAVNSIIYSSLTHEQKIKAMEQWQKDWDVFLDAILSE